MTLLISETDALTNETVVRPMTEDEIAQREKDIADEIARKQTVKDEVAAVKAKRQVLLEKLGITEEEAKILLG